jgi:hypothetical protein
MLKLSEDFFFFKVLNCNRETYVKLQAKKWFLIKVLGGQVGSDVIVTVSKQFYSAT